MKNLFNFFERISATLVLGLLFSFGISAALASYTPSEAPGDPYELITPNFNALLIGNGGLTDPSQDDLKVEGNATVIGDVITDAIDNYSGSAVTVSAGLSVNGTVKTDTLDNYTSGSSVTVSAPVTATTFGDIYYRKSSASTGVACSSSTCPTGSTSGYYYVPASCAVGDYILGCTGYDTNSSTSALIKGTWITKSGSQYFCNAEKYAASSAASAGLYAVATCYSPDEAQGTNTSTGASI